MTSNLLSRLLPTNTTGRSIYEELRANDDTSGSDVEERAGLALDEENLRFRDDELDDDAAFNIEDSRLTTTSPTFLNRERDGGGVAGTQGNTDGTSSRWLPESPRLLEEDGEDEVPHSLLIEGNDPARRSAPRQSRNRPSTQHTRIPAMPGPSSRENRAHWEAAQAQQQLHTDRQDPPSGQPPEQARARLLTGTAKDRAMWRWNNVTNIDLFMHEVYQYYQGRGMWSMVTDEILKIL